eukprot:8622698-Alexandrium_andersonii.AAC.1
MVAAGTRDAKIAWGRLDQKRKVEHEQKKSVQVIRDDEWEPLSSYVETYGSPETNGLGHSYWTLDGVLGVRIPSKRAKIRNLREESVKLTNEVDDGTM